MKGSKTLCLGAPWVSSSLGSGHQQQQGGEETPKASSALVQPTTPAREQGRLEVGRRGQPQSQASWTSMGILLGQAQAGTSAWRQGSGSDPARGTRVRHNPVMAGQSHRDGPGPSPHRWVWFRGAHGWAGLSTALVESWEWPCCSVAGTGTDCPGGLTWSPVSWAGWQELQGWALRPISALKALTRCFLASSILFLC